MAKIILTLLTATFLVLVKSSHISADGFDNFVRDKMANFSNWVTLSNLDPTPPMSETFGISHSGGVASVEIDISNLIIDSLPHGWLFIRDVETNPEEREFSFGLEITSYISFSGYHKTNATISRSPVTGVGIWSISVNSITSTNFTVQFVVDPTGYLNATEFFGGNIDLPTRATNVYFENVTDSEAAQGFEEVVKETIYQGFQISRKWEEPIYSLLRNYWESVLSESTLADLVEEKHGREQIFVKP